MNTQKNQCIKVFCHWKIIINKNNAEGKGIKGGTNENGKSNGI